jgi:hypothetical protein
MITTNSIDLTWTAPVSGGAVAAYTVLYRVTGSGAFGVLADGITDALYTASGLAPLTSYDFAVYANNSAGPGGISPSATARTWGAALAWGDWTAAATQTHGASVAPNGGVNFYAVPATGVSPASWAFAWSQSNAAIPTSGLISAGYAGATNKYGAYFNAPAAAGTWYLWALAYDAGSTVIGVLVSGVITVA